MTIRDDIGALPPDAIAQVVRAYDDAVRACAERRSYNTAHAAGCAAFREALAAVLPQEAGAARVQQAGEEVSPVTMSGDLSVASGSLRGSDAASPVAPSRAPSEAAPPETLRHAPDCPCGEIEPHPDKAHKWALGSQGPTEETKGTQ